MKDSRFTEEQLCLIGPFRPNVVTAERLGRWLPWVGSGQSALERAAQ